MFVNIGTKWWNGLIVETIKCSYGEIGRHPYRIGESLSFGSSAANNVEEM